MRIGTRLVFLILTLILTYTDSTEAGDWGADGYQETDQSPLELAVSTQICHRFLQAPPRFKVSKTLAETPFQKPIILGSLQYPIPRDKEGTPQIRPGFKATRLEEALTTLANHSNQFVLFVSGSKKTGFRGIIAQVPTLNYAYLVNGPAVAREKDCSLPGDGSKCIDSKCPNSCRKLGYTASWTTLTNDADLNLMLIAAQMTSTPVYFFEGTFHLRPELEKARNGNDILLNNPKLYSPYYLGLLLDSFSPMSVIHWRRTGTLVLPDEYFGLRRVHYEPVNEDEAVQRSRTLLEKRTD